MLRSIVRDHWAAVLLTAIILIRIPTPALAHTGTTHIVEISEDGFSPNFLEILAGDSIEFVSVGELDHWPASNVHPTHELYADFDARRPVLPGGSWSFVFLRAGLWGFHDHLNPHNMGQVVVRSDTHQGLGVQSGGSNEVSGTGLVRVYNAARIFLMRIFDAAKMFVEEAFQRSVASVDTISTSAPLQELSTEFRPPPDVDLQTVYRQVETVCAPGDFDCFEGYFRQHVITNGPDVAVELVNLLREDGTVSSIVDEHQLAHKIGQQTAESYGVNEQAFLLCPMESLNGGCQHGFFEFVLGRTESTSEAADLICQALQDGYTTKFQFYCYHGVGHGVMMAAAYDLARALESCDTFNTFMAQDGCWQGVFMENVAGWMQGIAREGIFLEADPLAPCNGLAEKYQHECYINHSGYLMAHFDDNVELATHACLEAADDDISSCLQSIGLMVTNPVWQANFIEDLESISFEDASWEICLMFPAGHLDQCVIGAIDNIHNFDDQDVTRAETFCKTVDQEYRMLCYERMGVNILNLSLDLDGARELCTQLSDEYISTCLSGAGIGVES